MTTGDTGIRFVPTSVIGLSDVTEVTVHPDRLELLSEGAWIVVRFRDIAQWYRRSWLYRPLARLGLGAFGRPSVADRDWFHPPSERFFRFYTVPDITIFMPDEPADKGYPETIFYQVHRVIAAGGFSTEDLG